MLLSIIIPTYNSASHIAHCLSLIQQQLGENHHCEVVVVDGKSTDETLTIVESFTQKIPQLRWISEKDKGIYDAMNKGMALAHGKFLYFLGADDEITFTINQITPILQNENTIYYGNVLLKNTQTLYDGAFTTAKLIEQNICHQAIFYPKKIVEQHPYNLKYKLLADYELNLKLWSKYKFEYVDLTIAVYSNDGISTQVKDVQFKSDFLSILYKYLGIKYVIIKIYNKLKRTLQ